MPVKSFILLFILTISANVFSQSDVENAKWAIGGYLSPDYTYRHLQRNGASERTVQKIAERNRQESALGSLSVGLLASRNIKNNLNFQSGFSYGIFRYKIQLDAFFEEFIDPGNGFINNNDFNLEREFHYLEIPIELTYVIDKKDFGYCFRTGVNVGYLMNNADFFFEKSQRMNVFSTVAFGVQSEMLSNAILKIEPTLSYGHISVNYSSPYNRLWKAGLQMTYLYKLKK